MSDALPGGNSLQSEARELGDAHNQSLRSRRFASARSLHKELEYRTKRLLAELHLGDPAKVRQLPHAQWLLDNAHVLRASLLQIRKNLPGKYYRQLPMVATADGAGCRPRIAELVEKAVTSGDFPVDLNRFERFCIAYQSPAPLTIGELWALPTMLRIRLMQQICTFSEKASRIGASDAAAVELDELASLISGSITSLRNVSAFHWEKFIERTSQVDKVLRQDPTDIYRRMDFETRNDYRSTIERIARISSASEWRVAETALELSRGAAKNHDIPCAHHVGYYLVDHGAHTLYSQLRLRGRGIRRVLSPRAPWRAYAYLSALVAVVITLCAILAIWLVGAGAPTRFVIATTVVAAIPSLVLSSTVINGILSHLRKPRQLPKLDFSSGIPAAYRTIVAVPAMLSSRMAIDENLHTLELNYLGNDDPDLQFVLLTDHVDATRATRSEDADLIKHVMAGVDRLNRRYSVDDETPFVLLHRRRRWNARASLWMGWERKRGKLAEFNNLLRGSEETDFVLQHGGLQNSAQVRFVITLDADTFLPTGVAVRLAGTMAHPLNRAVINDSDKRVVRGYSILQPRVETNPATSSATPFARSFSGDVTLDLYTHTVSNVYQDLFGQGIFAGKGIYDVDAFRTSIQPHIPENRVLSHDLLEGLYGRAALVTDIVLLEDYPTSLLAHLKRVHRWVRGDWQLLPWLLGRPPESRPDSFQPGVVGRWQLFDNLSRSLLAPAAVCLFSLGWLVLPVNPWTITAIVMVTPGVGVLLHALAVFHVKTWRWGTARSSIKKIANHAGQDFLHWILVLAFLPVEALVAVDAIGRTLYRLKSGHRNLLEWTTAADVARRLSMKKPIAHYLRQMWPGPLWAGINVLALVLLQPTSLPAAAAVLFLWAVSPGLAFRIGQKTAAPDSKLDAEDQAYLRRIARGTWRFFEQHVTPANHWLPPDNVQLEPIPLVAEQTSPSNIGFALLSTAAAYDLGYTGIRETVYGLQQSLNSISGLEKYRGHLYNWYSLPGCKPLVPRYVSTVDSGNLAGAMIAVRQSLIDLSRSPFSLATAMNGIDDDLALLREGLSHDHHRSKTSAIDLLRVTNEIEQELQKSDQPELVLKSIAEKHSKALNDALLEMITTHDVDWTAREIEQFRYDVGSLTRRANSTLNELRDLYPWTLRLAEASSSVETEWPGELLDAIARELPSSRTLTSLPHHIDNVERLLIDFLDEHSVEEREERPWYGEINQFRIALTNSLDGVQSLLTDIQDLVDMLDRMIAETDFGFLYDDDRELFHVGYRVDSGELDTSYYDLLASEARLASFIAIAKGDVPPRHWIHLGRPITSIKGLRILLSWSATAFEYLMPHLLMQAPRFGLIGQSCRGAVSQQRRFGRQNKIPWGVSESGYHHFDQHGRYQYQAFGIPRLGLKWDQGERLVVSAYASFLALPFNASAVLQNARQIEQLGGLGELGFFEALDFGAAHLGKRIKPKIVQSYMAHHQGMILTAIANMLTGDRMIERFHRDTRIAKAEYLLYEKLPVRAQTHALETFEAPLKHAEPASTGVETWVCTPGDKSIAVLANGQLAAQVTTLGGGNLTWRGLAVTRWRSHFEGPAGGSQMFIKDLDRDILWSPGMAPADPNVTMIAAPDCVEIRDTRHGLLTRQQILVAPFANVEIRKLHLNNESNKPRRLMICSYCEPVLADNQRDARHPAFSKMFVECDYLEKRRTLLFRRRPLNSDDPRLSLACTMVVQPRVNVDLQFETDRREFIGRCGTVASPAALRTGSPQLRSQAEGSLDPIAAFGFSVTVPAGQTVQCAFLSAADDDEVNVLRELARLDSLQTIDWTITDARRHAQHDLMLLEVSSKDVQHSFELVGCLQSPSRPESGRTIQMSRVHEAQRSLWRHGISGDRPVVTVAIDNSVLFPRLESFVRVLAVCQARGVMADIVFLDESESAYSHPTQDRLRQLIRHALRRTATNRHFHTFIVPAYNIEVEERYALTVASQLVLDLRRGDWVAELSRQQIREPSVPAFLPQPSALVERTPIRAVARPTALLCDNGCGGIAPDSAEYAMYLDNGHNTPAPWCNILANPNFGTVISESGSSNTWFQNSSEYALTTSSNDPVTNRTGEAMYVRDEETGIFWSPLPGPSRDQQPYIARHGIGQTCFEHHSQGLEQSASVFVDPVEPIKYVRLRLHNRWPRMRRLTITYAAEWRLGNSGSDPGLHLIPDWIESQNSLYVRNAFTTVYPQACAFLTSSLPAHGVTFDGDEFLGPLRSWREPAGIRAIGLASRNTPCAHPLGAYQVHVSLAEGESCDLHFALGAGRDRKHAEALSGKARKMDKSEAVLVSQRHAWSDLLGRCKVDTPDGALNALLNAWLPYQIVSSRLWGRLGFYQASGAVGFRDQLQDVLALLNLRPDMAATHIKKVAGVQFEEGDVLHWWHHEPLRGVRTRCSDDLLWLPYAVARYVTVTRDFGLLDRKVPFLNALPLAEEEHERFAEFRHGDDMGSIYEHCCRAIECRMELGEHGLPHIGSGDWNDGFSRVGIDGTGESVWMAWFLIEVCRRFEPLCRLRKDLVRLTAFRDLRRQLQKNVEASAWAGEWYVRGFYDDGSVLGGPDSTECQIDLNAQTWAIIAGTNQQRQKQAFASAIKHLSDEQNHLIKLLTPPFHASEEDPGYIKSYPPGVRENGGQYNHAATWAVLAAAKTGNPDLAMRWLSWLNPLARSSTPETSEQYRIEPYVAAADIYSCRPYAGRGGWSWYSGSAAWLYRVVMEELLGIERRGNRLHIEPCLPANWEEFKVSMKYASATYQLHVYDPSRITRRNILIVENDQIISGAALTLQSVGNHDIQIFPDETSLRCWRNMDVAQTATQ